VFLKWIIAGSGPVAFTVICLKNGIADMLEGTTKNSTTRRPRFTIASLLVLLTLAAILLAWMLDHQRLKSQIHENLNETTGVYRLSNTSAAAAIKEIAPLFTSEKISCEPQSNSVIVCASPAETAKIELMLRYIDR